MEGRQDVNFFRSFLKHLAIDDVVVQPFEGRDKLKSYLRGVTNIPSFNEVESLGIVRDANSSADSARQSVEGFLAQSGLPAPGDAGDRSRSPQIGIKVFVVPDNKNPGMLETLLWRTLDAKVKGCVTDFLACTGETPANRDKARVAAYLATRPRSPYLLGVSAQQGVWNYDHPALTELQTFLCGL